MSRAVAYSEQSLVVWLTRLSVLTSASYLFARYSPFRGCPPGIVITLSCVTPLALSWLLTVTENVPRPYLDEIFHLPQAQVYCHGRYFDWDDKITTPPGLYLATIVFNRLFGFPCSIYNLRAFNVFVVSSISVLVLVCRAHLTSSAARSDTGHEITVRDIVTGINIALFPVLFFFSGLYYTDPASTLIVLLAYANHLTRVGGKQPSFLNDVYSLGLGILALGFRQTNIFWVVVYMGGLEVISAIKTLSPETVETPKFQNVSEQLRFYAWRYSLGDIHDPSLSLAQPVDIILCIISIGIAAICNLPLVLRRFVWPHGVVLTSFVAFVAWNGGVVLGDKSNHVATLHLAQMLYIWPFFAFFSAPLFIPQLLNLVSTVYGTFTFQNVLSIRVAIITLVGCGALAVALLVVRFNTIIHPFTLADNRHYVFYVFRYSILRAWWIRYALAPIYVFCAWLCWGALQGAEESHPTQGKWIQSPFIATSPKTPRTARSNTDKKPYSQEGKAEAHLEVESPATSTMLILLLTTSLSLVTAPLVEPRYFILPWVFWRLLVPATPVPSLFSPSAAATQLKQSRQSSSSSNHVPILLLETAWFILINAATMYIFVMKPFYWRAPDGTLQDEGQVQRFMW
ncbi:DIE2/ALG10 family-domain-containing protein [Xylaria telfairii]|nr:DIE2/ALG10 family-domain-containing protein [Xylaria telfairii]